jgi:hypothetical protein
LVVIDADNVDDRLQVGLGVMRARLMMNTNGFPVGAAPASLSSGDRVEP